MFSRKNDFEPFENKVWLASPTMHDGAEMKYVKKHMTQTGCQP